MKPTQPLPTTCKISKSSVAGCVKRMYTEICDIEPSLLTQKGKSLLERRDYLGLVSMQAPTYGLPAYEYRFAYFAARFWSKYSEFDLGIDRTKVALDKFLLSERMCASTNSMFRSRWNGSSPPLSFPVEEVFFLARRKITQILRTIGKRDIARIVHSVRHGPNSDLDVRRGKATAYEKFRTNGSITEPCVRFYDEVFPDPDYRQEHAHNAKIVRSSRLTFVPKNARTDRVIMVEPRWNVYAQLGLGELIADRLRSSGQDIRDQTRNVRAAQRAYADGLATVDMSMASDLLSVNLIIDLLSTADPLWCDWIMKLRSPSCILPDGRTVRLEKVSSMGNGYTFPLETLVFYSFAVACCQFLRIGTKDIEVYGDDIVLPREAYPLLAETLEAFGMLVNRDKSFADGDFFESCGSDFLHGVNVRPVFIKKMPGTVSEVMILHNQLFAFARRCEPWIDMRIVDCARRNLLRLVPKELRLFGPPSVSGVFHALADEWLPYARFNRSDSTFSIRALQRLVSYRYGSSYEGHLWSKLSQDVNLGNRVLVRDVEEVDGLRKVRVTVERDPIPFR